MVFGRFNVINSLNKKAKGGVGFPLFLGRNLKGDLRV